MKLAGTTFIRNGLTYDYHFKETIECLLEFCDHVFVVDAGSDDLTVDEIVFQYGGDSKISLITLTEEDWLAQTGKEKLAHFSNIAIEAARKDGYDYVFYLQADEIVHEKSYKAIREAIATGKESFMVTRHNLWGSPYRVLTVPQERKPCSTEVVRLAKTNYITVDDAENIGCADVDFSYLDKIVIYHMGFVRRRSVMRAKIINMQENVFMVDRDKKLDEEPVFNPWLWFDKERDTNIIKEPLPLLIRAWAEERAVDY